MNYPYEPNYTVPPGETIKETMEHYGMTVQDLARESFMAIEDVEGVLSGSTPITDYMAKAMGFSLLIPASLILNLEKNYRADLKKGLPRFPDPTVNER